MFNFAYNPERPFALDEDLAVLDELNHLALNSRVVDQCYDSSTVMNSSNVKIFSGGKARFFKVLK